MLGDDTTGAATRLQVRQAGHGGVQCLRTCATAGAISMPYYDNGSVRIRYDEAGSGFALLVIPGGGLNSRVSNWSTAVYNFFYAFKDEYRVITMDQPHANQGESAGPLATTDTWAAFADDQLGLMDHLGVRQRL